MHHPTKSRNEPIEILDPKTPDRVETDTGIECINCSVCYAACDTVSNNVDFLGPAALQRAWTLYLDPKDADPNVILDAVSGKGGCHNLSQPGQLHVALPQTGSTR